MGRAPRCTRLVVEPRKLSDDSIGMSPLGVAAFFLLWSASYDEPEPGVLRADDRYLASRARATHAEWATVKGQVAAAFDTTSRPGFWIRQDVVAAHQSQTSYIEQQRSYGRVGGKRSAETRSKGASSDPSREPSREPQGYPQPVLGSGVQGSTEKPTTNTSPPRRRIDEESDEFKAFYATWPRREGRDDAWKAWKQALSKHPELNPSSLLESCRPHAEAMRLRERQYWKQPGAFLRSGAFLDAPHVNGYSQAQTAAPPRTARLSVLDEPRPERTEPPEGFAAMLENIGRITK